ncbi:hypothetical protein NLJ89_g3805 [Agrocybe chaxingu]|uniref:GTP cyclohydrolase II n=1 Tax=Agrocybe chaxingu TaxID=84603 RepID=A0A9W8MV56_9AGAR|nr:hypothetical protein NLJ89_g3805 [Agrocybe chaxingu]
MTALRHTTDAASADAALLDMLTGPNPRAAKSAFARRDAALDPLLIAAAFASGPHVTRNHYHHDFFPGVMLPKAEGAWDWTKYTGEDASKPPRKKYAYVSRQGPRRQRLASSGGTKENDEPREIEPLKPADNLPLPSKKRRPSVVASTNAAISDATSRNRSPTIVGLAQKPDAPLPPLEVKCMARTRIPTPHGPAFLHLYHNNRDSKEHLAIVIDPAQLSDSPNSIPVASPIRSRSLDSVWSETETEMDRIIRGAYVADCPQRPSKLPRHAVNPRTQDPWEVMRCDCGEQLDEAIRQISLPISLPPTPSNPSGTTIPGRGAVIYLRQEGRGIGLLSKIRAYNLQDMGHDTVTANLMLGHKADERGYEIAGAVLRDLGLGSDPSTSPTPEGVRVLTNNPDKVEALKQEGVWVAERVPMIPRSWQQRKTTTDMTAAHDHAHIVVADSNGVAGATMIGGKAVHGEDLDKYLRTKVLRMGHMLPLWMEEAELTIY